MLLKAKANRSWTPETVKQDKGAGLKFLDWIDSPGLSFWHELRADHIEAYKKTWAATVSPLLGPGSPGVQVGGYGVAESLLGYLWVAET